MQRIKLKIETLHNDFMLPVIITCNSAISGLFNDFMLPLIITCNSADSGPLNDFYLELNMYDDQVNLQVCVMCLISFL